MPYDLGRRVKARRIEMGLTQQELATRLGLHPTTISLVEHARHLSPRTTSLILDYLYIPHRRAPEACEEYARPRNRGECRMETRPCPFVSCRYHLYLDVNPVTGSIKFNFPELEVWEMAETCALDVADRGGRTLAEVGKLLNLSRERIRQMEASGLEKMSEINGGIHGELDSREVEGRGMGSRRVEDESIRRGGGGAAAREGLQSARGGYDSVCQA